MRDVDPAVLGETEERTQLRGVLRGFFAATSSPEHLYKHMAAPRGFDEELWSRLAGEIGVQGLAIPEEYGGSGFSFTELAVALEEAGRALACGPLLSTAVLASFALQRSGDRTACQRYLPGIAAGTLTATVAGFDGHAEIIATPRSGGWAGTGHADFVLHGADVDLIVVVAQTGSGVRLFACETGAGGLTRRPRRVLDDTRPQALVTLSHTPLIPIGAPGAGAAVVDQVLDIGRAALAAEQVGGSAHALAATVSYVRQRRQFGRPIGSFQAVKHRLADLLVDLEAARSVAAYAAACVSGAPGELPVAARAAQIVCSETYRRAAAEYVQLHGGIGFTWEHPAHLYVRRARSAEVLFGTADENRTGLGRLLGLAA
jgi:alkylation response protein AidB-like acyl-CoA dehydrogenase